MGSQHLRLSSSGHLSLSTSGHLRLYDTFTIGIDSYSKYAATVDRSFSWPDSYAPQSELNSGCSAALTALATGGSQSYNAAQIYYQVLSWSGTTATVRFGAVVTGWVYKLSPTLGTTFPGEVVCPILTITQATNTSPYASYTSSAGFMIVGTGSSAPSGNPRGWSANLHSGGTSTLTNVTLNQYLWVAVDLTDWSIPNDSYPTSKAALFQSLSSSGTIK